MDSSNTPNLNDTLVPQTQKAYLPFFALGMIFYFARFICRVYPSARLWWDDLFLTLGAACQIVILAMMTKLNVVTGGHHIQFLSISKIEFALKYSLVLWIFVNLANLFVKTSLTLMVMRLKTNRLWRISLSILLGFYVIIFVGEFLTVFLQCRPVSAFWNVSMRPQKCWSGINVLYVSYGWNAFFILTDLIISLLPISFIRNINRPLRERIILSILMATGLVATAMGIAKIVEIHKLENSVDYYYKWQTLAVWMMLELSLGIMAACVPTLKAPFDRLLKKMGFKISRKQSTVSATASYRAWMSKMSSPHGTVTTTITAGEKNRKSAEPPMRNYSCTTSGDSETVVDPRDSWIRRSIGVTEEPYKPELVHFKHQLDDD